MKGLKARKQYNIVVNKPPDTSGRFGKCERLKIFWETLVGSNPTSCTPRTIFDTCYSIKNGSVEPDSRKFRIMVLSSVWAIKHLKDPSSILGISLHI